MKYGLLRSMIPQRDRLSVCLSVTWATVLTHSPDVATSMRPLLHYCSHLSVHIYYVITMQVTVYWYRFGFVLEFFGYLEYCDDSCRKL